MYIYKLVRITVGYGISYKNTKHIDKYNKAIQILIVVEAEDLQE
jgi:hypothetical protein